MTSKPKRYLAAFAVLTALTIIFTAADITAVASPLIALWLFACTAFLVVFIGRNVWRSGTMRLSAPIRPSEHRGHLSVGGVLLIAVFVLWRVGAFDHQLAGSGLNAKSCGVTALGNTVCGKELETVQAQQSAIQARLRTEETRAHWETQIATQRIRTAEAALRDQVASEEAEGDR